MNKKSLPTDLTGTALVCWSDDKELYYLPEYCETHSFWLGLAIDGLIPPDKKNNSGLFSPGWLQIKHKDGRVWYRKLLRFSFWKVSDKLKYQEELPISDDKVQVYLCQLAAEKRM